MNYKSKKPKIRTTVVKLDPIPLEVLMDVLNGDFERKVYAAQSNSIMEIVVHPYVMETDVWGIQLYRLTRSIQWDDMEPLYQHAFIRRLKSMIPGV